MLAWSHRIRRPAIVGVLVLLAGGVAASKTCEDPSCRRPTQRVQRVVRRRTGNARPSEEEGDAQPSFVPPGKQTVLIVDDDEMVRKVHARFVERLGYGVETASDGVEALRKLALGIDLVLLDLHMPNMDGFEVAKRMREHPTHGLVPIIVVTGSDREAWYPRALEVGANDVLGKPINVDELRLRTRWLMELRRHTIRREPPTGGFRSPSRRRPRISAARCSGRPTPSVARIGRTSTRSVA